ncbi:hypothetical protein ACWC09_50920 [Streptomyces sp. NPDC001617]
MTITELALGKKAFTAISNAANSGNTANDLISKALAFWSNA